MDTKLKIQLTEFYGSHVEQVGDLATWIHAPQRRYHRHEFFGIPIARVFVGPERFLLVRDLGYGGCGLLRNDAAVPADQTKEKLMVTLQILDQKIPMTLGLRFATKSHVGSEFLDITPEQQQFLRTFIQFMDGALQVRQIHGQDVFPAYRGNGWLNLAGHRDAIRFNIRFDPQTDDFEASLVYVMDAEYRYASWAHGAFDLGILNGPKPTGAKRTEILRQVVCMLAGIRQGASLPGFEPITNLAIAALHRPEAD